MKFNRKFISVFSLIVALFLLHVAFAQNATAIEPRKPIEEVWRKDMNIPVSGEIRTGVVFDISSDSQVKDHFYVQLPEEKFNLLFVEITSNDGRYNATLSFDINNAPSGQLMLKWSTEFYNDLKAFNSKELTILSWLGNEENAERDNFVVSSWTPLENEDFVYIVLNSEHQALINIYDSKTGESIDIKCEQFEDQAKVSFCAYCKVPLKHITKTCEISVIQRARRSFNRYPLKLKL
jgi:hypothetical protein